MKALIQSVPQGGRNFIQLAQAAHWFWERGYEVIRFSAQELQDGKLDDYLLNQPDEIVMRGGVGIIYTALERANRPAPPNIDLPPSLKRWFGRPVSEGTLDDVRDLVGDGLENPVHVKPLRRHKLFTGQVFRTFADLIRTAKHPGETPVLIQGVIDIASEWRVTILRDRVLGCNHYTGDPLVFPDATCIREAIPAFEGRPIGFAMDWGITRSGETLLIEVNDGFSLGNYGIPGYAFTALIEARWRQLMGLPDNGVGFQP